MEHKVWKRYIGIHTVSNIDVDDSALMSELEKSFKNVGISEINSEKNTPSDKQKPRVKVEAASGDVGVWIGEKLIFMPDSDTEESINNSNLAIKVLKNTRSLVGISADGYSLNSIYLYSIDNSAISTQNSKMQNFIKGNDKTMSISSSKVLPNGLEVQDVIEITKSTSEKSLVMLTVDMNNIKTITPSVVVGDLLDKIIETIGDLRAHENELRREADTVLH